MSNPETHQQPTALTLSEINEGFRQRFGQFIGRCTLAVSTIIGGGVIGTLSEVANPQIQQAAAVETGGYPDVDAKDCSAKYGKYAWCMPGDDYISSRGYAYRNCTDWVAFRAPQLTSIKIPWGWSHAKYWDNKASEAGYAVDDTPEPGDIAVWEATKTNSYGHVEVVESVNKDGSVNTTGYNKMGDGTYRARMNIRADKYIDLNGAGVGINGSAVGGSAAIGTDTIGVYNPSLATFDLRNSNTSGNHDVTLQYGNVGAVPLKGDWNGDGIDTIGVYNPNLATFDLKNSNSTGAHDITFQFGNIGGIPIVGDWNGDKIDTVGIYYPDIARFDLTNSNSSGPTAGSFYYGNSYAIPLAGDWNGDDRDSVGVFYPDIARFDLKNVNATGVADASFYFGNANTIPLAGDWNGDGNDSIGIYNPSLATFDLKNVNATGAHDITLQYGNVGAKPIVGDWDGQ